MIMVAQGQYDLMPITFWPSEHASSTNVAKQKKEQRCQSQQKFLDSNQFVVAWLSKQHRCEKQKKGSMGKMGSKSARG